MGQEMKEKKNSTEESCQCVEGYHEHSCGCSGGTEESTCGHGFDSHQVHPFNTGEEINLDFHPGFFIRKSDCFLSSKLQFFFI